MKTVAEVADADLVIVLERLARGDRLVVQIGAIAAAHVLKEELALDTRDTGVLTADGEIVGGENHVAAGIATQNDAILVQSDALFGVNAFENEQIGHETPLATQGVPRRQFRLRVIR